MAIRKTAFEGCDSPECDQEIEIVPGEPTPGYFIDKGRWDNGAGGGPIPKVYACSAEHLGTAILARIEEEW